MIPEPDEYLSFLMGADAIADQELTELGVKIDDGVATAFRRLVIPDRSLSGYRSLIRNKLTPGYWNDIVGRQQIIFIFKLADGNIRELTLAEATRSEISHLCSSLNNDPIDKTSDVPRYLAGNPFYRDMIESFYGRGPK